MSSTLTIHLDLDLVIRYVVTVLSSIILNLATSTSHIHGGMEFFSPWSNHSEYYNLIKYSASILVAFASYYVKKKGSPGILSFILASFFIILVGLNAYDLPDALKMCCGGFSTEVLFGATGGVIRGSQHKGFGQIVPAIKPGEDIILRQQIQDLLTKWVRDDMPDKPPENSGHDQSADASELDADVRSLRKQLYAMQREHVDQMSKLELQMKELKLQMTELMENQRIGHQNVVRKIKENRKETKKLVAKLMKRESSRVQAQVAAAVLTAAASALTNSS